MRSRPPRHSAWPARARRSSPITHAVVALLAAALVAAAASVPVTALPDDAPAPRFGPTDEAPAGGVLGKVKPGSRWKYRGVLGKLGDHEQVVAPAVEPPGGRRRRSPTTGLPGRVPDRPAVVIKVDNTVFSRPQTGLDGADIVYEELVEGGETRFAAVFHSRYPPVVGPVRSGRSTDIGVAGALNLPVFGYSGSNNIFDRLFAHAPLIDRGAEVDARAYWRQGGRPAPYNYYTSPRRLVSGVRRTSPPDPQFAFRWRGLPVGAAAIQASTIRLAFSAGRSHAIRYEWDAARGGWARFQSGSPHRHATGAQIAPENVVVQIVDYVDTGMTDRFGEIIWEAVGVGTGLALVFTDGKVLQATWTRPTLRSVTTFTDADGDHVRLTPGQTWVELIAPQGVTFDSVTCDGRVATIVGSTGNDVLRGTAGDDVIAGLGGHDRIAAGGGDDVVCGGFGRDRVRGGGGNDTLFGDDGADTLNGGPGNDRLRGGNGVDRLVGAGGTDSIDGGPGADRIVGTGEDRVRLGTGDRVVRR